METDQLKLITIISLTSFIAVSIVLTSALASIATIALLKHVFAFIITIIAFICELIVAVVAALVSGTCALN